jgi:hypothetical protein
MAGVVRVTLEVGKARTFAVALDWPGWCRSGKTEAAALASLFAYAPRYAAVVKGLAPRLTIPGPGATCDVVERLSGNASTEFGAPGTPPSADAAPVDAAELEGLTAILRACWEAFDRAADAAEGTALRTGPRGGGRALDTIREHVAEANRAYLGKIGGRIGAGAGHAAVRDAFVTALGSRARGEVPDVGPRGGKRWSTRFAVRYVAWHTLDHAWEIEDRAG